MIGGGRASHEGCSKSLGIGISKFGQNIFVARKWLVEFVFNLYCKWLEAGHPMRVSGVEGWGGCSVRPDVRVSEETPECPSVRVSEERPRGRILSQASVTCRRANFHWPARHQGGNPFFNETSAIVRLNVFTYLKHPVGETGRKNYSLAAMRILQGKDGWPV